jgi:hypothetical protein
MMRSSPKITKVQLKVIKPDETVLMGIVSAEPDYRISLSLNKKMRIALKNINPVVVCEESGTEISFSRFADSSATNGAIYELTSNRSGKSYLLRKLKNIDFLLFMQEPEKGRSPEEIINLLRSTDSVTAVFQIETATLKDKNLHHIIH